MTGRERMGIFGKMSKNTKQASKGKRKQSVSVSKLLADYFVQGLLMVFVFFIVSQPKPGQSIRSIFINRPAIPPCS